MGFSLSTFLGGLAESRLGALSAFWRIAIVSDATGSYDAGDVSSLFLTAFETETGSDVELTLVVNWGAVDCGTEMAGFVDSAFMAS